MEVKLKVLGGARSGTEIPLKKEEFVIGRAPECTLRAGSDAISRRHCAIVSERSRLLIHDLGSRNGTFVNDARIESTVELHSGDEVRVGPLRFQVLVNRGLDARKLPEVKDVAEAAARTAEQAQEEDDFEVSISEWLTAPERDSKALAETTSLRLDETHTGPSRPAHEYDETEDATEKLTEEPTPAGDSTEVTPEKGAASEGEKKRDGRKKPGKLPPIPKGPGSKDSREAAAEVLRAMTRRR